MKKANSFKRGKLLSMDELDDDLLLEIVYRLPTAESACRCKLVSKRWNHLISGPHFLPLFLNRVTCQDPTNLYRKELSSVFLTCRKKTNHDVLVPPRDPLSRLEFSSTLFFSCLSKDTESIRVLASFNDLIYCCPTKPKPNCSSYFLCNLITKKWVSLPPPPPKSHDQLTKFGFFCEPYISMDGRGRTIINTKYRFRIMLLNRRFPRNNQVQVEAATYHSETGQWSESILWGQEYNLLSDIVAFNGKLHWFNGFGGIVAYDSFEVERTRVIDIPHIVDEFELNHTPINNRRLNLGVCDGFLCMAIIANDSTGEFGSLTLWLWVLKDYSSDKWCLKHKLRYDNMVYVDSVARKPVNLLGMLHVYPIAFNPSNSNILYLDFWGQFVVCNIRTGELYADNRELPCRTPLFDCKVFPFVILHWPTPIQSFGQFVDGARN